MKRPLDVMAFLAALGAAACGGSVSADSGAGSGGTSGSGGAPVVCAGLEEHACQAQPGCSADHCSCSGAVGYVGCRAENAPPTPCPVSCPFIPCAMMSTATACDARNDCHSVYLPGDCACVSCCCTVFDHCANGGSADCKGPATCDEPAPDCANQTCNGVYAVSHVSGCYEGCVLAEKCL